MVCPLPIGLARCLCAIAVACLVFAVSGCVDDPATIEYTECPCEVGLCGATACTYELSLHPNCNSDVDFAEVLVDDYLEEEFIEPGQTFRPCAKTLRGESSVLWIRGGSWIWGPLLRTCTSPADNVHTIVLQCVEGG